MFVKKFEAGDWKACKAIRLEALSRHEDVFGGSYKDEAAFPDERWKELVAKPGQAFFGLYYGETLIGCTGIFTDKNDASGKTALLVASYVREEYRGRKLSRLLYQARIDWAKAEGCFERIAVGHKEGNEASRRANQAFGFNYIGNEEKPWGDGTVGTLHRYEMRI